MFSTCKHCDRSAACPRRGLCRPCFRNPAIRQLYPPDWRFLHRGVGLGTRRHPLPLAPTSALPGSAEKIAVLEERARLGQTLWHPADATLEGAAANILRRTA